jgi:putative copper resistance protein D
VAIFIHTIPEWLELIALAFCIGTIVCRLLVLEASIETESPQRNLLSIMWRLFGIGIAAMVAGAVGNILIRAMEISGQPFSSVFPVLPTVVFQTHLGRAWLIRISALILLSVIFMIGRRFRDSHGFLFFMLCVTLIISMMESASGHASDKGDFTIPEIMDWLHLLAASIWGGGLLILSVAVLPELAKQGEQVAPLTASFTMRFSRIAGIAVGVIAITALYNAWVYVGSLGAFLKTPYGWTAIAKTFLFSIIMYLGAFNRYVSVPLLQQCACYDSKRPGIIERIAGRFFPRYLCTKEKSLVFLRFMWSVKVEAILMVGVLLCAALLRHEVPASHVSHMEHHEGKGHSMQHNDGGTPDAHSDHPNHGGEAGQ